MNRHPKAALASTGQAETRSKMERNLKHTRVTTSSVHIWDIRVGANHTDTRAIRFWLVCAHGSPVLGCQVWNSSALARTSLAFLSWSLASTHRPAAHWILLFMYLFIYFGGVAPLYYKPCVNFIIRRGVHMILAL